MSYCKYHPLSAATHYCHDCQNHTCDHCTDEAKRRQDSKCFLCGNTLQHLGTNEHAEPFWRHFEQSFRYPLNPHALGLIVVLSLISAVAEFIPFGIVLLLIVAGIQLKYAFSCLKETADGNMKAPMVGDAYSGGLVLLIRFYFMLALTSAPAIGAAYLFGANGMILVGLLTLCALPAVVIVFAISDSIVESLNPLRSLGVISAIGLPYGLLLAIIMIMTGSVEALSAFIPLQLGLLGTVLQALASNYYTLVAFHIMGYMIYQYQDDIGFSASGEHDASQTMRSDSEKMPAYIEILVKEGEFELAQQQYQAALKQFPTIENLRHGQFELALALTDANNQHSLDALETITNSYLVYINQQQAHKLTAVYKRALNALPSFMPNNADIRLHIARNSYQNGDNRTAVKLLNGMHKQHPNFRQLPEAFDIMAKALDEIPNMQAQADKARQLAAQYAAKQTAANNSSAENSAAEKTLDNNAAPRSKPKPVFEQADEKEVEAKKDLPAIEFS